MKIKNSIRLNRIYLVIVAGCVLVGLFNIGRGVYGFFTDEKILVNCVRTIGGIIILGINYFTFKSIKEYIRILKGWEDKKWGK